MARILVVDDDLVIRALLTEVLVEESGHTVVAASNGKVALDLLQRQPVDAVVCDVNMPIMDGVELVRRMRATPHLRGLPVLMISAAARLEQIDPDPGIDLMLEKPFEISSLQASVEFILSASRLPMQNVRVSQRQTTSRLYRNGQDVRRSQYASSPLD